MSDAPPTQRIDKWLWVARFFKTRPQAVVAVNAGRVHVNGQRVKPSKEVAPGDRLEITKDTVRLTVFVRAVAPRRVSAAAAAKLYDETPESIAAREAAVEERRLAARAQPEIGPRPTKRDRRRYEAQRRRSD